MEKYDIIDPAFRRYIVNNARLKQLATGFDWVEGPVWFGDADCLLFSDIPNNKIHRWNAQTGLSTYRAPSHFSNGNTRDHAGRLVTCEHGMRRVTRTEYDGTITVIADRFQGKRLNSPNDVVVKSDGSIWFTDPHYGIICDYEGHKAAEELSCNVYRVDPQTGAIDAVITDFDCPNGLAFSPDESVLYVADTGRKFDDIRTQHIRAFRVTDTHTLRGGDIFHKITPGAADGFRLDCAGNIWSSAADGVHCISPAGALLGKIFVPELVSNLCFGGRAKHQLFITATTSVYMIGMAISGC